MGYKKYSPFLKSIKILMLISFMYFTTRLDALQVKIPVTTKKFNYEKLPVYCADTTRHFKCLLQNGTQLCIPEAFKCKITCANDAELNCEHAVTKCKPGQYQCHQGNSKSAISNHNSKLPAHCIPQQSLCDNRVHCPFGDDENPSMCAERQCSSDEFSCKSPGHCISKNKVCDGQHDCLRLGLDDTSDEENCAKPQSVMRQCNAYQVACNNSTCVDGFRCDGNPDCDDRSDEANCPSRCTETEIMCDGKCLPASRRCDGAYDCNDGSDEHGCRYKGCGYASDRSCPFSSPTTCRRHTEFCDGTLDCPHGEDEVCVVTKIQCKRSDYWTCKSGKFCIHNSTRCDGNSNCPDGSDEENCPTKAPPTPPPCQPTSHLCNGTQLCISLQDACYGKSACPYPDATLVNKCKHMNETISPCVEDNGGCQQICTPVFNARGNLVPQCSCQPGWEVLPTDAKSCIDINECSQFGTCSQLCNNTIGNYTCSCRPGYTLSDEESCVAHGAGKILYSTNKGINIIDTVTNQVSTLITGLRLPKYIAYDAIKSQVFFHTHDGSLGQVGINGKGYRTILKDRVFTAIAYDWARRLLFYVVPESGGSRIGYVGVINTTTGYDAKLKILDCPHGLAANPELGLLYVTLWCGQQPGVYTLTMDGKRLQLLIPTTEMPGHVALDLASSPQRLFWINERDKTIESANLSGGDQRRHITMKQQPSVLYDVAVFEDSLYCNDMKEKKLQKINKFDSSNQQVIVNNQPVISVTVYHSALQPRVKVGSCGKCSQICIAGTVGSEVTCLCDQDYLLLSDGSCLPKNASTKAKDSISTDHQLINNLIEDETEDRKTTYTSELKSNNLTNNDSSYVTVITSVAIGFIACGALIGLGVYFACIRNQDKQSVSLESFTSSDQSLKTDDCPMPKVNSRTPLTDYEINLDSGQI